MYDVQKSKAFNIFINLSILANTIILAMDDIDLDKKTINLLELLNVIFSFVFLIEMIVNLLG